MGSDTRRNKRRIRTRTIEQLEDRQMFSADPIGGMLGGSIEQHALDTAPSLVHHASPDADFWIDSWSERDLDVLAGDLEQTLASAHNSTGLTGVRNDYGFTGAGQTVAVIDSGIAWNHTGLGNGLGANYRVVGGWDFTENDANPYDDGPWGSHGTHVAGIVGANSAGTNNDGVAPGVDLVGLRVFDDAGSGYFHWVESALRWVHQNRNAFENPITAVNLSLGTSWNSNTIPSWTTLEDEFAQLKADGIFVAVSAGNAFSTYKTPGLSYPAASPHVVPVMSVTDNGNLSSFSQRHTRAIAAPGQSISSTVPDYVGNNNGVNDDYASYSGTSMASPYIAGASVLLREAMQFVGYTNITQDTIYNHMMNTATSFYDSATKLTYKRINLANAISSLMPTDDYGSTTGTAHNLGTLSGTSQVAGLIGKLNDADVFRFTAVATGTVTFSVNTSHNLAPVWNATGGQVSGNRGQTLTLDVVAGKSYTIGLSTSGGIGYYGMTISAATTISYTDWGTITQTQRNDQVNAGETWYRVTAGRTGWLTAEALFATAGGNIDLGIYSSSQQLMASGTANASGERADAWVNAGSTYFVRVTGTNSDVDFRVTNLVSISPATLHVAGTSAADMFTYSASGADHTVSVNGTIYVVAKALLPSVYFAGDAGNDTITMTGSAGSDTAILAAGISNLNGAGYSASALGIENLTVNGGGGSDVTCLYGTIGNDIYRGWSNRATMVGADYSLEASGFVRFDAIALLGTDDAYLYDSAGDDLFRSYADRSVMSGSGFFNRACGFDRVHGNASDGADTAMLFDSTGDGVFASYLSRCTIAGASYVNEAMDFDVMQSRDMYENIVSTIMRAANVNSFTTLTNRAEMRGEGARHAEHSVASTRAHTFGGVERVVTRELAVSGDVHARVLRAYIAGGHIRSMVVSFDELIEDRAGDEEATTDFEAIDHVFNTVGVLI